MASGASLIQDGLNLRVVVDLRLGGLMLKEGCGEGKEGCGEGKEDKVGDGGEADGESNRGDAFGGEAEANDASDANDTKGLVQPIHGIVISG